MARADASSLSPAAAPALAFIGGVVSGAGRDCFWLLAVLLVSSLLLLSGLPRRLLPAAVVLIALVAAVGHAEGRIRIEAVPSPSDLTPASRAGGWLAGRVRAFPEEGREESRWTLGECRFSVDGRNWESVAGTVAIRAKGVVPPAPGTTVVVGGRMRPARLRRNFGTPSPEAGRAIRGEVGSLSLEGGTLCAAGERTGFFRAAVYRFRRGCLRDLAARCGERTGGVLAAMVLGAGEALADGDRETFRRLGVSHLLAVSGLHLGILFGVSRILLLRGMMAIAPRIALRLRVETAVSALAAVPPLLLMLVSGADPPAVRAFVSLAVLLAALAATARVRPVALVAILAAGMTAGEPLLPFTASFALSFAGAAGLILFFDGKRLGGVGQALWVPPAAFVSVGPATLSLFHSLPLLFYPANLILSPLFGIAVIPLTMLSALLLPVAGEAGAVPLALACGITGPVLDAMDWIGSIGPVELPSPGLPAAPCLAASLLVGWVLSGRGSRLRRMAAGGVVLTVALAIPLAALRGSEVEVTFLDLPVGESILVRRGRRCFLVDAGGTAGNFDPAARVILPELRSRGLVSAEALVVTHPHADHAGGAGAVAATAERVLVPFPAVLDRAFPRPETTGCGRVPVGMGETYRLAGMRAEILWPPRPARGLDGNDLSVALVIRPFGASVLLAGDLAGELLTGVAERVGGTEILKATHHGGGGSRPPGLLATSRPRIVVVTGRPVDRPSRYPTGCAEPSDVTILDTAQGGAVRATIGGRGISLSRPRPLLRDRSPGRRGG